MTYEALYRERVNLPEELIHVAVRVPELEDTIKDFENGEGFSDARLRIIEKFNSKHGSCTYRTRAVEV